MRAQDGIMKRKSEVILRISVVALVIIALFLVISLLSELNTDIGPNLAIVVGLLVTVLICVSLDSWVALAGETTHKTSLLISLLLGSGLFLLLSFVFGLELDISSPAWREYHPSAVHNLSVTTNCLFALASILAVEAIAVLISIARARGK
jgi:hypothetical protein